MSRKTPVSLLQEYAVRRQAVPAYELIHNGVGTHNPEFIFRVRFNSIYQDGKGRSKQEAKHNAAAKMLNYLSKNDVNECDEGADLYVTDNLDVTDLTENFVGDLKTYCIMHNYGEPMFDVEEEAGLPHDKVFKMYCRVSNLKEFGIGKTKRAAKRNAALNMLNELKKIKVVDEDEIINSDITSSPPLYEYIPCPSVKLTEEEVLNKYCSYKGNVLLNKNVFYYKDHEKAYLHLHEISATLSSVCTDPFLVKNDETAYDLLKTIAIELEASISIFKAVDTPENKILLLKISGVNVNPPIASWGVNPDHASFNMLHTLLILNS